MSKFGRLDRESSGWWLCLIPTILLQTLMRRHCAPSSEILLRCSICAVCAHVCAHVIHGYILGTDHVSQKEGRALG